MISIAYVAWGGERRIIGSAVGQHRRGGLVAPDGLDTVLVAVPGSAGFPHSAGLPLSTGFCSAVLSHRSAVLSPNVSGNQNMDHSVGPTTARLQHRALVESDAESFFKLNSDPRVMRWTGECPLESVAQARAAIADYPDFQTVGYGRWGCVLRETGQLIGFCGLKYLPEFDVVDVGYRFVPDHWGKGLATEACQASVQFGFETLGLDEIVGFVIPENTASIRVLEKVGLQRSGEVDVDGQIANRYVIYRKPT